MSEKPSGLKLGSTLYSFTTEYHARDYSFEALVRKVAEEGIGPGLEIVGFQSIKGFPVVTDAFAESFAALIGETGLELSCLGINADAAIDRERDMSETELVAYHERQLEAAAKLGFPVVRYQWAAGPSVIRQLVPLAERLGVKMGLEIHASHHVQHPVVLEYREMYEKAGSPMLGFIPDFGASAHSVPPSFLDFCRDLGISESLIGMALDFWCGEGDGHDRMVAFHDRALVNGEDERLVVELFPIFGLFSRQNPRDWAEIVPQTVHIHGKFFDFEADGSESAIDYAATLPVFVAGGYSGYMSSEYEGHHWTDADGFDKVRRHHALAQRILAEEAALA